MTRLRSLQRRLGLAAAGLILLALVLAGAGLTLIFDHVLDRHAAADLDGTARFLAGQLSLSGDGRPVLASEPPDPRYAQPYGGLYWQVDGPGGDLRSRSLWDRRLDPPPPSAGGRGSRRLDLGGPDGGRLLAVALAITVRRHGGEVPVTIVVALDRDDLARSRGAYLAMLVPSLGALGVLLAAAMWVFVHQALRPFRLLRADLRAVHEGSRPAMPDHFPDEVQPLVDDLNRLLALQARALQRARQQAGDLAHGLKTPLAVLSALARTTVEERPDLSRAIEEQASAMGRQVERSLLRARLAAGRALMPDGCRVAGVVTRLVDTLRRLPDADSLSWDVVVDPDLRFPGAEEDLMEIAGNLLDNARKWAHRRVGVRCECSQDEVSLVIADDGPGMTEEAIRRVERGRRWDATKPGTGFGLAIAADVAEEAGGRVVLSSSDRGGLEARLAWSREPRRTKGRDA